MGVLGKFQRCFKEVLSVFQDGGVFLETFKGASQLEESSKGLSKQFQGSFNDILRKF